MQTLTLADIVSRATPVSWFEGVAVTQALCGALAEADRPSAVPDLSCIQVTANGRVEIDGALSDGQPPVQGAGRVLLALVPEHQMPVQLRLLALTAVSPAPSYASVQELSAALDYFARPDRDAQVRAVYERCLALPAISAHPEVAPLSVEPFEPPRPAERPRPKGRGLMVAVIAVTGAMLALAGILWVAGSSGSPERVAGGRVADVVSEAAGKAGALASGAVDAVSRQLGLAPESIPPGRGVDVVLPFDRGVSTQTRRREPPLLVSLPALDLVRSLPVARVDETVMATVGEANAGVEETISPAADRYYTAQDEEVSPPALLRPRLPQVPPTGVRLAELPRVDLVVTQSGEVEWVRLWPANVGVHSAMMLSAIKNWRFEPARKDGRAVRYRQTIALTSR